MRNFLIGTIGVLLVVSMISCGKAVSSESVLSETADVSKKAESTTAVAKEITGEKSDLQSMYPEYFGLDTSKGLEVYVWQMSEGSYYFGLMEGTNRDKEFKELIKMKAASAEVMKEILASYGIDEKDVTITPWQNPISSYISKDLLHFDGESESSYQNRLALYLGNIRKMIF